MLEKNIMVKECVNHANTTLLRPNSQRQALENTGLRNDDGIKLRHCRTFTHKIVCGVCLKGLSHEIDFKNVDEYGQILALSRAAAGF